MNPDAVSDTGLPNRNSGSGLQDLVVWKWEALFPNQAMGILRLGKKARTVSHQDQARVNAINI